MLILLYILKFTLLARSALAKVFYVKLYYVIYKPNQVKFKTIEMLDHHQQPHKDPSSSVKTVILRPIIYCCRWSIRLARARGG